MGHNITSEIEEIKANNSSYQDLDISVLSLAENSLAQFKDAISYAKGAGSTALLPEMALVSSIFRDKNDSRERGIPSPEKEASAQKRLYGEFVKATDAVSPEACTQPYDIGNCYFVAAMASLAKVNPQAIVDMIKVNDDGTYSVKFPGASKEITVAQPTADELAQVGGKTKYGDWPVVLMKAYGKYCGGGKGDMEGADGGSAFSAGVKVLTDKGVVNYGIGYMIPLLSWSSLDGELKAALNVEDALPVTVSTAKSLFSDKTTDGFVRAHVYSVLKYEPDGDNIKQSKVTVRNPWGGKDATRVITLQQFSDNFMQLSIPRR